MDVRGSPEASDLGELAEASSTAEAPAPSPGEEGEMWVFCVSTRGSPFLPGSRIPGADPTFQGLRSCPQSLLDPWRSPSVPSATPPQRAGPVRGCFKLDSAAGLSPMSQHPYDEGPAPDSSPEECGGVGWGGFASGSEGLNPPCWVGCVCTGNISCHSTMYSQTGQATLGSVICLTSG